MAARAEISTLFVDQSLELGGVGFMTGKTSPVGSHRGMLESHKLIFFLMAFGAELVAFPVQQFGSLGSVWIVTRQAFSIFERRMLHLSITLERLHLMALQAEFRAFLIYRKRLLGGSSGMAHGTFPGCHRSMDTGP